MQYTNIKTNNLEIGNNVFIEPTAVLRGIDGNAKKITIGDNVYIGNDVQIICDEFSIGDYSKIHHHTNIHGYKPCIFGHNVWIGQYSIIDSIGSCVIGNNCGIGAHSQLWSHIKYGDTLEGCRFLSDNELRIGNDVWFVGHCIVSPITAEDKSMALVGSVVTKNMRFNQIYAGSPAKSISDKVGGQFKDITIEKKYQRMLEYLKLSEIHTNKLKIVKSKNKINFDDDVSYFDVSTRQYKKMGSEHEINFMKFLLPEKAKFTPIKYVKA